jgi:penicillin-binding protein 2
MANGMCIIANKGYYYTPHFVRAIDSNANDPALKPYRQKHQVTNIADTTYNIIARAMQDVVESGTARGALLEGVDICAKTGTVENKAIVNGQVMKMKNHSMFVAFAPREHPKIAIAVAVENAGFGATWAAPIASLMIEKYLRDTIATSRKPMEDHLLAAHLIDRNVYLIDSAQRLRDRMNQELKEQKKKYSDSMQRAIDSTMVQAWIQRNVVPQKNRMK